MKLRPELEPQIEVAEKLFPQIMELISKYDDAYDSKDKVEMQIIIDKINQLTDKNIKIDDLFEYWEGESQEEIAFKISLPEPMKVENVSKDELLEIIRRMQSFDDECISDILLEFDIPLSDTLNYYYYYPLLKRNFSHPNPFDLFDRQLINGEYIEYSIEEIADIIISHKPIML